MRKLGNIVGLVLLLSLCAAGVMGTMSHLSDVSETASEEAGYMYQAYVAENALRDLTPNTLVDVASITSFSWERVCVLAPGEAVSEVLERPYNSTGERANGYRENASLTLSPEHFYLLFVSKENTVFPVKLQESVTSSSPCFSGVATTQLKIKKDPLSQKLTLLGFTEYLRRDMSSTSTNG